jgi:hypothetical protein
MLLLTVFITQFGDRGRPPDRLADAKAYFLLPPRNDAVTKPAPAAITIRPSWTSEPPEVNHGNTVVIASGLTTGHGMHKAPSRISTTPVYLAASLSHSNVAAVLTFIIVSGGADRSESHGPLQRK